MVVDINEASRFGILVTDSDGRIIEFEERSLKIHQVIWRQWEYIFLIGKSLKKLCVHYQIFTDWTLANMLFHISAQKIMQKIYSYKFRGYWKDVGTLESYWHANMELIDIVPEFNLYQSFGEYTRIVKRLNLNIYV